MSVTMENIRAGLNQKNNAEKVETYIKQVLSPLFGVNWGQSGGNQGAIREQSGGKLGVNLSESLIKKVNHSRIKQTTRNISAQQWAKKQLCSDDFASELARMNEQDISAYIYVFSCVIPKIQAGQQVNIDPLADKICREEGTISKNFILTKIAPILEEKDIIAKKSDNKYYWSTPPNQPYKLKGNSKTAYKSTAQNDEKCRQPVVACRGEPKKCRQPVVQPAVACRDPAVPRQGIYLQVKQGFQEDYSTAKKVLNHVKPLITKNNIRTAIVIALSGMAAYELYSAVSEVGYIWLTVPFVGIGSAVAYAIYQTRKINHIKRDYKNKTGDSIRVINDLDNPSLNNSPIKPFIKPQVNVNIAPPKAKETVSCYSFPKSGVKLGTDDNGNVAYWGYDDPNLKNRNIVIFGLAGGGKTYLLQRLINELNILIKKPCIVFDFKPAFKNKYLEANFLEKNNPKQHYLAINPVNINPLQKTEVVLDVDIRKTESAYEVASRVTHIFKTVYSDLGSQQQSTLANALEKGMSDSERFYINDISAELRKTEIEYTDKGKEKIVPVYTGGELIANKIDPLIKSNIFGSGRFSWGDLLRMEDHGSHIIQTDGVNENVKKVACEFLLEDLYGHIQKTGSKNDPTPIVIDECHNMSFEKGSPARKALKEGRGFGVSLLLATQGLKTDFQEIEKSAILQSATIILFEPAQNEKRYFAKMLNSRSNKSTEYWEKIMSGLGVGQCLVLDNYGIRKVNIAEI